MSALPYLVAAAMGYPLGTVRCAVIVARRHGTDLDRQGDGNPGAWNALEALGARRAWPAFAGDGAKALVAGAAGLAIGWLWTGGGVGAWWAGQDAAWWSAWAGVAGAMLGHAFPPAARGRGGKSVMAFAGGVCLLTPVAAAACLALCAAVSVRRGFAWGARVGIFALPLVQLATDPVLHVAGTGALMTFVGVLFAARRRRPARASAAGVAAPKG